MGVLPFYVWSVIEIKHAYKTRLPSLTHRHSANSRHRILPHHKPHSIRQYRGPAVSLSVYCPHSIPDILAHTDTRSTKKSAEVTAPSRAPKPEANSHLPLSQQRTDTATHPKEMHAARHLRGFLTLSVQRTMDSDDTHWIQIQNIDVGAEERLASKVRSTRQRK